MERPGREKEQQPQKASSPEMRGPFPTGWLSQPWTALLFVSLLSLVIYSNTFFTPFHFDDKYFIADNKEVKSFSSFAWSGSRYVSFLSFAVNYRIGRLNVFGYHLAN